jgi:hypothetical protein
MCGSIAELGAKGDPTLHSLSEEFAPSKHGGVSQAVDSALRLEEGASPDIAATGSFDPAPHRETDWIALVNGMSTRCTRSRLRM